jgi:1-acyl-sn-glycerol-3-phosphate acyltransferase
MELRRLVRLVSVLLFLAGCFLLGGALWLGLRGCRPARQRQAWAKLTQHWARTLLWLLGVRVTLYGNLELAAQQPALLVANHQSYLDILICAAHLPARFVAKRELRQWPGLGALAALGGTLFLDRASTQSAVRCVYRASQALRQGAHVQVFPEGTTTDGGALPQFKPLFFAAALRARAPVQPLTIALQRVNGTPADDASRSLFYWIDDDEFARHFWSLLAVRHMEVALIVHPLLAPSQVRQTQALSRRAQLAVQTGFTLATLAAPTTALEPEFYFDLSQV